MKVRVVPEQVNRAGGELLELSRSLRRARECVEDTRRQLRQHSQLEECRRELQKQEQALSQSIARLERLSGALEGIAELYRSAEVKNAARLNVQAPARDSLYQA